MSSDDHWVLLLLSSFTRAEGEHGSIAVMFFTFLSLLVSIVVTASARMLLSVPECYCQYLYFNASSRVLLPLLRVTATKGPFWTLVIIKVPTFLHIKSIEC